jgi:hypothetical protein
LIPDEIIEFFSVYLILPAAVGPRIYSSSNRDEHQKQKKISLGSKALLARKAYNLTAIREPVV